MRKFKGFTLIELIVVLATFSIIMFGALSLMTPVSKMMVQADVHEGASAAASNITRYLEQELSGAEYLYAGYGLPDSATLDGYVKEYVQTYYEGVLKAGSTTSAPVYASGDFHLLTIDNTKDAKISRYTYHCAEFDLGKCDLTKDSPVEYAVNKAYYDDYDFQIKVGTFDDLETFNDPDLLYQQLYNDPKMTETQRATNYFADNVSAAINFTVMTTANGNHTDYHFLTNTAFPMVNLTNRNGIYTPGNYFIINQEEDSTSPTPSTKDSIVDIADATWSIQSTKPELFKKCRTIGPASNIVNLKYVDSLPDGYWFIYSYGSEIDTKKTATS